MLIKFDYLFALKKYKSVIMVSTNSTKQPHSYCQKVTGEHIRISRCGGEAWCWWEQRVSVRSRDLDTGAGVTITGSGSWLRRHWWAASRPLIGGDLVTWPRPRLPLVTPRWRVFSARQFWKITHCEVPRHGDTGPLWMLHTSLRWGTVREGTKIFLVSSS